MRKAAIAKVMVLTLIGFGSLSGTNSLRAENPYINIPEMQRLSREAWNLWWNSLTSHQQQIVHAVSVQEEKYRRDTGIRYIPVNQNNLLVLMKTIGAYRQDAELVWQRMRVHESAWKEIDKVDRMLDYMQSNPNWYLPPNMQ